MDAKQRRAERSQLLRSRASSRAHARLQSQSTVVTPTNTLSNYRPRINTFRSSAIASQSQENRSSNCSLRDNEKPSDVQTSGLHCQSLQHTSLGDVIHNFENLIPSGHFMNNVVHQASSRTPLRDITNTLQNDFLLNHSIDDSRIVGTVSCITNQNSAQPFNSRNLEVGECSNSLQLPHKRRRPVVTEMDRLPFINLQDDDENNEGTFTLSAFGISFLTISFP